MSLRIELRSLPGDMYHKVNVNELGIRLLLIWLSSCEVEDV